MAYYSYKAIQRRAAAVERGQRELPPLLAAWQATMVQRVKHDWGHGLATNKQMQLYLVKIGEIAADSKAVGARRGLADVLSLVAFGQMAYNLTRSQMWAMLDWLVEEWDEDEEERLWVYRNQARADVEALWAHPAFRRLAELMHKLHDEYDRIVPDSRMDLKAGIGVIYNPHEEARMIARMIGRENAPAILAALRGEVKGGNGSNGNDE